MKKIIIYLIAISFMFISNVKADMAAPEVMAFDVFVSNKDGAKVIKEENTEIIKTLPYNTKIKIGYSTEINGKIYYSIKDESGYVLDEDVTKIKKEVKKEEGFKLDKQYTYKVLEKNGIIMYKGPNNDYFDKVAGGIIPYGTTFKTEIGDVEGGTWNYVEYNGYKGWVSTYTFNSNSSSKEIGYQNMLAQPEKQKFIVVGTSINLCEDDLKTCKSVSTKANEIIESTYSLFITPHGGTYYYFDYKGYKGWTNTDISLFSGKTTKIKLLKQTDLYDTYNKTKKIGLIKANTEIKTIAGYSVNPYSEDNDLYVDYNGTRGWIHILNDDYESIDDSEEDYIIPDDTVDKNSETKEVEDKTKEKNIDKNVNIKKETNKYIIACIIGAVTLSLAGILTIILINKKKKIK